MEYVPNGHLAVAASMPLVLELAQGHYIAKRENVLLVGQIGTGKTHLATALGVAACRQGYRVRFTTAAGLTNELLEAQAAHRLSRVEQQLLRHQLLIIDEVGFVPFTKIGADLLFSFLAALHEQVSVVVTTTVPFADWADLFGGDQRLAAALLDTTDLPRAHRAVQRGKLPAASESETAGGGTPHAVMGGLARPAILGRDDAGGPRFHPRTGSISQSRIQGTPVYYARSASHSSPSKKTPNPAPQWREARF